MESEAIAFPHLFATIACEVYRHPEWYSTLHAVDSKKSATKLRLQHDRAVNVGHVSVCTKQRRWFRLPRACIHVLTSAAAPWTVRMRSPEREGNAAPQ